MAAGRLVAGALTGAFALTMASADADAITLARVTRRGYILVDEPTADVPYEGRAPVTSTQDIFAFTAEITRVLEEAGMPRGSYIAVMQQEYENASLAFYLGLINDTRGIGERSALNGRQEIFDLNPIVGTEYPVTGFVFLNQMRLYIDPIYSYFGRYFICTQEFGHRYGTFVRNPPQPGAMMPPADGGVEDAGERDASESDASERDASESDASPTDAGEPDASVRGADLAADALLGRQRAHWSYFVHSGGSPMEGNNWAEISPGVFRTDAPSLQFSPVDLYLMGLLPASAVPPFFVIAEPDVMGQRDNNGRVIWRESGTNNGRAVSIRGRRVDVTIDDLIATNGPRDPAYVPRDAGAGGADASADGGGARTFNPDLPVIWVMLTTADQVTNRLGLEFDRAVDSCTLGYGEATRGLSQLIAVVPPMPDAGVTDAGRDAAVASDAGAGDAAPADAFVPRPVDAVGGCGCTTPGGSERGRSRGLALGAALALAGASRRRRVR